AKTMVKIKSARNKQRQVYELPQLQARIVKPGVPLFWDQNEVRNCRRNCKKQNGLQLSDLLFGRGFGRKFLLLVPAPLLPALLSPAPAVSAEHSSHRLTRSQLPP